MKLSVDYLVVGSGLTGATIARLLHDAGREVLVIDRRTHAGGNVHDHIHASGIPIHTYGPHYFRTDSEEIWEFVNRFTQFHPYQAVLKSWVDGQYENWPIAASFIRMVIGHDWEPGFTGTPTNFEEACLAMMPRLIYDKFVKGYTEKQWGVAAATLTPDLAQRFNVRDDDDPRLVHHKYQGIPTPSYAGFMQSVLTGIPLLLNTDYLQQRGSFVARRCLVFTGPIDEFFGNDLGRLAYRGQRRAHIYLPDVAYAQPCGQVNNPDPANGPHIRTLEWKHMLAPQFAARVQGTVLTQETTCSPAGPNEYEYPFPNGANARLFEKYRTRAETMAGVMICGRLGEYRYYDMDQAIERAMVLAKRLLNGYSICQGRTARDGKASST